MCADFFKTNTLIPHLFRQEYARMTAVLCGYSNVAQIDIAENIACETFLKATKYWPVRGIPENPRPAFIQRQKNKRAEMNYRQALQLTRSIVEKRVLERKIGKLIKQL